MKSLLVFRRHFPLFALCVLLLASPSEAAEPETVVICIGAPTESSRNKEAEAVILDLFSTSGLTAELFYSPAKRAEHQFKTARCDGFFVSTLDFPAQISRKDIVHVPESILQIHVEAFVTDKSICTANQGCLAQLKQSDVVGVFRSHGLLPFLKTKTKANIVEVTKIEHGIDMLKHSRLDVLVLPDINIDSNFLKRAERLASVDLYLWMDKRFESKVELIADKIRQLKETPAWQSVLPPFEDH